MKGNCKDPVRFDGNQELEKLKKYHEGFKGKKIINLQWSPSHGHSEEWEFKWGTGGGKRWGAWARKGNQKRRGFVGKLNLEGIRGGSRVF